MQFRPGKQTFLAILLLLGGLALAREIVTYPPQGQQPFLGLDDTSAPTQVQDGRATDLQNVALGISKDLRQRHGYSLIGDTLDVVDEENCAVTGLYYTRFASGTDRIVSTCGTHFKYLNGTSWTEVTGAIAITAGQNNQFVWTTAFDNIIGTNDVNAPFKFNGSAVSNVDFSSMATTGILTRAKTVAFFKNFLIFANTYEGGVRYPTRFRWGNVGELADFDDEDFVDVGELGGQEINAMAELYDNLYLFLTDSIYRASFVAGADTFNFSKVTDDIGAIAKNSVQSITLNNSHNGLIFVDKDKKVYFFNGIAPVDISTLITNTMSGLSAVRLQYAVSADSNTDYYLCATNGSGGINNLCLDLQYQIGEWTKHTNIPANAMAHVLDANRRDQVYFGTGESFVYQLVNTNLVDDVGSATGIITQVSTDSTTTASARTVLYNSASNYVTGALAGAPITITEGPGRNLTSTISHNTMTGIIVTDNFSVTPDITSQFEAGAIDGFYTTKWYDMGQAARLKHFGELYFWGEDDAASDLSISYATDFFEDLASQDISLSVDTGDAIWGSAIWGTSLWGGSEGGIFRQVKQETEGRYLRVKFQEDDPGETFHLFGWNSVYWWGDVN